MVLHSKGRALTVPEKKMAKLFGVSDPEIIRVVIIDKFPMPSDNALKQKAQAYGLGSDYEGARTIGNIIMIKPQYSENSVILSHELVHVAQHDKMGRKNFVKRYMIEMEIVGYSRSPLELEAYKKQRTIEKNF